ncbi:hypothetical protein BC835DRAFT_1482261 [Cytidiella melzeri]|nr:hypothetical protein BC835DRAFT_1482261 [Cytidiella melzeri]
MSIQKPRATPQRKTASNAHNVEKTPRTRTPRSATTTTTASAEAAHLPDPSTPRTNVFHLDPALRDAGNSPMATSSMVTHDAPQRPYTEIPSFSTAPTIPPSPVAPVMAGVTTAQANHDAHATTPITPTATQDGGVGEFPEGLTMEELAAQFNMLQAQMARFTAPTTHNAGAAIINTQRVVLPSLTCAPNSVPKPKGSAGGGQRGYHLKAAMGLTGHEGAKIII